MSPTKSLTRTRGHVHSPLSPSTHSQPSPTRSQSTSTRPRSARYLPTVSPLPYRGTVVHDDFVEESTLSPDPIALEPESDIEQALEPSIPSSSSSAHPVSAAPAPASHGAVRKGKSRALDEDTAKRPEKRVLPARVRRAPGGGAEGIRDLEEMIVDWLERWGAPCTTPPDELVIQITTLPLNLIHPPTFQTEAAQPGPPAVTLTPTRTYHHPLSASSPRIAFAQLEKNERIETPSWTMVKPGEDDKEEAKEELELSGRGSGKSGRGPHVSPVMRSRKDEPTEETSDAYYISLHRRYEVFERRQRIREKEKLVFERYKMRTRMDLLRNKSPQAWSAVVSAVLSRREEFWTAGRARLAVEGIDWLRNRLVREGLEVLERYDQLLPVEKKQKQVGSKDCPSSRATASPEEEDSPGPPVVNARVAALRDPGSGPSRRASAPATTQNSRVADWAEQHTLLNESRKSQSGYTAETPSRRKRRRPSASGHDVDHDTSHLEISMAGDRRARHHSPFYPPETLSGRPVLVEAAARRESALADAEVARFKVAAHRSGRLLPREKTRTSMRLGMVAPFGMPLPSVVEYKSEFTLSDEEDFWSIIAEREGRANEIRQSMMASVSKEEAMKMQEVEAVVVL